jgi:hypothetical protein
LQSAVSQNCILPSIAKAGALGRIRGPADYKSAIQQIENLRCVTVFPSSITKRQADCCQSSNAEFTTETRAAGQRPGSSDPPTGFWLRAWSGRGPGSSARPGNRPIWCKCPSKSAPTSRSPDAGLPAPEPDPAAAARRPICLRESVAWQRLSLMPPAPERRLRMVGQVAGGWQAQSSPQMGFTGRRARW